MEDGIITGGPTAYGIEDQTTEKMLQLNSVKKSFSSTHSPLVSLEWRTYFKSAELRPWTKIRPHLDELDRSYLNLQLLGRKVTVHQNKR